MKRTHYCGRLGAKEIGQKVVLEGWVNRRRDLGGLIFIDLRDREGLVQVVVEPQSPAYAVADSARGEYVLRVSGTVRARPPEQVNPDIATGKVEVLASEIEILNRAETPPFAIDASWRGEEDPAERVSEDLRLKYRYIDLRRKKMIERLWLRHRVIKAIWDFLHREGFIQVETPFLTRSTPEGARDFLVPSRLEPGKFYALPQSPQLFKQMLMISGVDRYFQIARCFRDEDLRADRQPDFTQLDMEMSFVDQEDIWLINERLVAHVFRETLGLELPLPFPRISYHEAMERYGTDKPDTRFGLELRPAEEVFEDSGFNAFASVVASGGVIRGLIAPGEVSRKQIARLEDIAKRYGAKGLAWVRMTADGPSGGVARFLDSEKLRAWGLQEGQTAFFVADGWQTALEALGQVRLTLAEILNLPREGWNFLWVVDFPLLERDEENQSWTYMHHPFTSPYEEDLPLLESDPGRVRARAYDLVLNGTEVGGGSIRIHKPELQQKMFNVLGISPKEAEEKFGFFLEALRYGAPPHGGIAWGLDRFLALMSGAGSIRDVIPFPKTQSGRDPLTDAPAPVSPEQLAELHLAITDEG
ncbi:aspartate--tRNA ligase [Oceanithermus sp.]